MKFRIQHILFAIAATSMLTACEEGLNPIGGGLVENNVEIVVDSTFVLTAESENVEVFDTRSTTNLIGQISVPEYGNLKSSFVAQLMCAAANPIPDSIGKERIDSVKLIMKVATGDLTGDSLAPQQLTAYKLTKRLPADITNNFDPTGYYDRSKPLGRRSYTLAQLAPNDTISLLSKSFVSIPMTIDTSLGREIYSDYQKHPEIFQWPESFAEYFPGIYVEPSFGKGCIANITQTDIYFFYHYRATETKMIDGVPTKIEVVVKDSVSVLTVAPEALSSNNISMEPSQSLQQLVADGNVIITSPGGYHARIKLPISDILTRYKENRTLLSVVNSLELELPVSSVKNDYSIDVAPTLLLVPTKDVESFFAENKIPDNVSTFYATYNSTDRAYKFAQLRQLIMELLNDTSKDPADYSDYTLIPVSITLDNNESQYIIVTGCTPFIDRPTMTQLNLSKAKIRFTYSKQNI